MSTAITKKQREQVIKDKIFNLSLMKATMWGVGGAVAAGGLTALACYKSKSFNKATSPSAKTALTIMPSLFLFGLNFELTTLYASRNPEVTLLSTSPHHHLLSFPILSLAPKPTSFALPLISHFASLISYLLSLSSYHHLSSSIELRHQRRVDIRNDS